jgi:hypothetical protein
MKNIFIVFLILISLAVNAQKDTTYFFGVNGKIVSGDKYEQKKEVGYLAGEKIIVKTYLFNGNHDKLVKAEEFKEVGDNVYQIKFKGVDSKGTIIRKYFPVGDSVFRFTDSMNDKIITTGFTKTKIPFIYHGMVAEYYDNGNKMSESVYNNNELVSDKNWKEDGTETYSNVFYSVDEVPRFLTGVDFMNQHIIKAFKNAQIDITKINGKMVLGFVVTKEGNIGSVKLIKGLNEKLDLIALNAINSLLGEWVPATLNDKPVNYFQLFPISFSYTDPKLDYLEFDGSTLNW